MSIEGRKGLGWFGIVRLGLVQAAIGAIVMLATSLINRVMVVEYGAAAAIPAALVAWHYGVQLSRPYWGHGSDRSARRTPWIIGGLGLLALGGVLAVDATIMMQDAGILAYLLAFVSFSMIGLGVGISGTALLALLASRVSAERKPAAAAITWTMMVAGIVVAAGVAGAWLDPFSAPRLAIVASCVALMAFVVSTMALRGLEDNSLPVERAISASPDIPFATILQEIWSDREARRFTFFVFLSMLAYSMQDLILEPFAGFLFAMSPGESTQLSSVQHSGILIGMLIAGGGGSLLARRFGPNPKLWITVGCVGSAIALAGLAQAAAAGLSWPLRANIFALGLANGVFAVAAVGAMLGLASKGNSAGEGARMGVWGAAQAIAFGAGGLSGAIMVDLLRSITGENQTAFQIVFSIEAMLFMLSAVVATATKISPTASRREAIAS